MLPSITSSILLKHCPSCNLFGFHPTNLQYCHSCSNHFDQNHLPLPIYNERHYFSHPGIHKTFTLISFKQKVYLSPYYPQLYLQDLQQAIQYLINDGATLIYNHAPIVPC